MLERIKYLCEVKGISIQKLEKELGLSNGSISKTENMRSDRLLLIAKYFNVSMEYLMGAEGTDKYYLNPETESYAQFVFDNPEHKILFDASKKVKPEDLQKALKAIGIFTED